MLQDNNPKCASFPENKKSFPDTPKKLQGGGSINRAMILLCTTVSMYPLYDTGNLIHKSTTPAYSYLYSGSVSEVEICRTYDEPKP